jgi:hypothetical protein
LSKKTKDLKKLRSYIKEKDGWWASIFAGPLANRLLEPICDIKWLTPNHLTLFSFFIGLVAAYFFFQGDHQSLIIGGLLVQLSFVVDCMDGQFARYSKKFSDMGAWLDRISDRLKDFAYFFALAFGFIRSHGEFFHYDMTPFMNFISNFVSAESFFSMHPLLHMLTMQGSQIKSWSVFPIAMIAVYAVFLIDYYVNQDMKFPTREQGAPSLRAKRNNPFTLILKFGLSVYKSIPILRFNIGEQALLITFFCFCNAAFSLVSFFALLGGFYIFYWPIAKYFGFTEEK